MAADDRSAADRAAAFLRSGKVRDLYALDDERLLLVASDRLSAFDVVLPTPIPDKGRILTGLSRFWFARTAAAGIVPNHLLDTDPASLPAAWAPGARRSAAGSWCADGRCRCRWRSSSGGTCPAAAGRTTVARARCAGPAPRGPPRERPAAGARPHAIHESGARPRREHRLRHDGEPGGRAGGRTGPRDRAGAVPVRCGARGGVRILLADTKFELGLVPAAPGQDPADPAGQAARLILIDEVMTPDSSRFWEAAAWEPGRAQASFDKQFVRDWLESTGWDKTPPGPELPDDVVAGTERGMSPHSSASPARRSSATWERTGSSHEHLPFRRLGDAQGGHPRSAGARGGDVAAAPRRGLGAQRQGRPARRACRGCRDAGGGAGHGGAARRRAVRQPAHRGVDRWSLDTETGTGTAG